LFTYLTTGTSWSGIEIMVTTLMYISRGKQVRY